MGCEVDSAFIQSVEHRPKPTIAEAGGIPLIDLSPLLHTSISDHNTALSGLIAEMEAACREWGFFQVVNHGVPSELLDRLLSASKEFFALPVEEKCRVRRDEFVPLGYYDRETTKNVRDWKEVFDFGVRDHHLVPATTDPECNKLKRLSNQWPEYPPHLRNNCRGRKYAQSAQKRSISTMWQGGGVAAQENRGTASSTMWQGGGVAAQENRGTAGISSTGCGDSSSMWQGGGVAAQEDRGTAGISSTGRGDSSSIATSIWMQISRFAGCPQLVLMTILVDINEFGKKREIERPPRNIKQKMPKI